MTITDKTQANKDSLINYNFFFFFWGGVGGERIEKILVIVRPVPHPSV